MFILMTDYIYLDHNATTKTDSNAVQVMKSYLDEDFGNPSSSHLIGTRAKQGLELGRQEVASLLGCKPQEVVFTSGGSEASNMVLKGLIDFRHPEKCHLITSAIEHPAILNPSKYLKKLGVKVTVLSVDQFGRVNPADVKKAIRSDTVLISIMLANNETGAIQPIEQISKIAKPFGIPVHSDAAQAIGKIRVNVNELGLDFLSLAGHKLYAPKGVGALFIRKGLVVTPLIHGAAQERGRRAGTESVMLCAGLGAACRVAKQRLTHDLEEIKTLRDRLQTLLFDGLKGLALNGHPDERLPNTLNVSVPDLKGSDILNGTPRILASTGAACHDKTIELSHVLSAMGVDPETGRGAIRLSLGRSNTLEQIDEAAELLINQINKMRGQASYIRSALKPGPRQS
jgi:cysteine desulfurase